MKRIMKIMPFARANRNRAANHQTSNSSHDGCKLWRVDTNDAEVVDENEVNEDVEGARRRTVGAMSRARARGAPKKI